MIPQSVCGRGKLGSTLLWVGESTEHQRGQKGEKGVEEGNLSEAQSEIQQEGCGPSVLARHLLLGCTCSKKRREAPIVHGRGTPGNEEGAKRQQTVLFS